MQGQNLEYRVVVLEADERTDKYIFPNKGLSASELEGIGLNLRKTPDLYSAIRLCQIYRNGQDGPRVVTETVTAYDGTLTLMFTPKPSGFTLSDLQTLQLIDRYQDVNRPYNQDEMPQPGSGELAMLLSDDALAGKGWKQAYPAETVHISAFAAEDTPEVLRLTGRARPHRR